MTIRSSGENSSVEAYNFVTYSGHNLNDLGSYSICRSLPTQKYTLVHLAGIGLGSSIGIGLCIPSYCSANLFQNYTDTVLNVLSNITRQDLTKYGPTFVDPDVTGVEKGFWFYFTIVVFAILIALVIGGTISANLLQTGRKTKTTKHNPKVDDRQSSEALLLNRDDRNDSIVNGTISSYLQKEQAQTVTPKKATEEEAQRVPVFIKIIECFDIVKNYQSLISEDKNPEHDLTLNVANGIRAFAYGWIVYGHTFLVSIGAKNYASVISFFQSTWLLLVVGAFYAVDTFLYLSGFFATFVIIGKLRKMDLNLKNYFLIILHRWIRLWPAYFIAILFYWKISVHLGSGPLWWSYVSSAQYCNQAWKNLLLLDNVLTDNFGEGCFAWGWYLAVDFQLFLLTPFICWIYIKNKGRSMNLISFLMTTSIVFAYYFSVDTGYSYLLTPSKGASTEDYMTEYYINPSVRMSPYLVGVWLGIIFREYKDGKRNFFTHLKRSRVLSLATLFFGLALLAFLVFFPRTTQNGDKWTQGFAVTWNTFSRPAFALGVFFLTAPVLAGSLEGFRDFMGNYYFTVIAKLSYCGYLIHLVFLQMIFSLPEQYYGFSQGYQACLTFAVALVSLVGALVIHLLVEKPIANLEKGVFGAKKPKIVPSKEMSLDRQV